MPQSSNIPISPKVKNENKLIQAAYLINNTTNNSMMNSSDSSSMLDDDTMDNNSDTDPVSASTTPEISTINHIKPQPPIFVKGIIDFSKTCEALMELIGVDNFYCKSSSDRLKIQTANSESY
ncbi:Hypothetical protein CINCED_3A005253 [Cinara cedri]|uniref:Uncharacterized protein n=1 Tax=Cinara cedri TaxID=506608 RepID=A0A5E4N2Z5_9HEMI|nr:Hypothetical protein CINCED_3A005253 [Cinara cedri]